MAGVQEEASSSSLLHLLELRRDGHFLPNQFSNRITRKRTHRSILRSPRIVNSSIHVSHTTTSSMHLQQTRLSVASSLDVSSEGRFLLAGRRDGTVLLYDLSKWGGEMQEETSIHAPVAQSSPTSQSGVVGCTIQSAQWYPVDSGAFLTAASNGKLQVWDSYHMEPVVSYTPFVTLTTPTNTSSSNTRTARMAVANAQEPTTVAGKMITSMHVSKLSSHSVAVSCLDESVVKLVDIRSGASSHSLIGHGPRGVLSVQWSPISEYVLASGGMDCCVRLWDIRKAGSHACLTILNAHQQQSEEDANNISRPYRAHYENLRQQRQQRREKKQSSVFLRNNKQQMNLAPNDYRQAEGGYDASGISSTTLDNQPVRKIVFDPSGHFLVACGTSLSLWDLRRGPGGYKIPRRFVTAGGSVNIIQSHSRTNNNLLLPPISQTVAMRVTDDGDDPTLWVASQERLLGYSILADDVHNGKPVQELRGHMSSITAMAAVDDNNNNNNNTTLQLVTSGLDGLILMWGPTTVPRKRASSTTTVARRRKRKQHPVVDQDNW